MEDKVLYSPGWPRGNLQNDMTQFVVFKPLACWGNVVFSLEHYLFHLANGNEMLDDNETMATHECSSLSSASGRQCHFCQPKISMKCCLPAMEEGEFCE